jgi:hypothetical protein
MIIEKPRDLVVKLFMDPKYLHEYQDGFKEKIVKEGTAGEEGCISTMYYEYGHGQMILEETITKNMLPDRIEAFYHHEHMDNTMICTFEEVGENKTRYSYEYEYTRINWFMPKIISFLFPGIYKRQGEKWNSQFQTFVEDYNE